MDLEAREMFEDIMDRFERKTVEVGTHERTIQDLRASVSNLQSRLKAEQDGFVRVQARLDRAMSILTDDQKTFLKGTTDEAERNPL